MPKLEPILRADINPLEPGPELCAVIDGVLSYHPVPVRIEILRHLRDEMDRVIEKLEKGAENRGKQLLQPDREQQNQG